jgi:hypothetical protein
LEINDDWLGLAATRKSSFLTFREKFFLPAVDIFRDKRDDVYTAVMISVGSQNTIIKRKVPTIFDAAAKVGGLYYSALFFSIFVSFLFF